MDRRQMNALLVSDSDLDCDCQDTTIDNMTVANLGFVSADLEKFDLIVYSGKRGTKILRSKYFKAGKIG